MNSNTQTTPKTNSGQSKSPNSSNSKRFKLFGLAEQVRRLVEPHRCKDKPNSDGEDSDDNDAGISSIGPFKDRYLRHCKSSSQVPARRRSPSPNSQLLGEQQSSQAKSVQFATLQEFLAGKADPRLRRSASSWGPVEHDSVRKIRMPVMRLSKDDWNVKCWEERLASYKRKKELESTYRPVGSSSMSNSASQCNLERPAKRLEVFRDRIERMEEKIERVKAEAEGIRDGASQAHEQTDQFSGENKRVPTKDWIALLKRELAARAENPKLVKTLGVGLAASTVGVGRSQTTKANWRISSPGSSLSSSSSSSSCSSSSSSDNESDPEQDHDIKDDTDNKHNQRDQQSCKNSNEENNNKSDNQANYQQRNNGNHRDGSKSKGQQAEPTVEPEHESESESEPETETGVETEVGASQDIERG